MTNNYTIYHLHSMLSNAVTNIDSVTHFEEYIKRAKECGMTALGFCEHGSVMEYYHKKCAIEKAGMKYIHGVEAYVTESLEEKVRDNMHTCLMARNYDGFLEINKLISKSFNRSDGHFYYTPRITFDELINTSDNIIITSACIGGILGKGNEEIKNRFVEFMCDNRERCFLEIGHHRDQKQVWYNKKLYDISKRTGLRLIAGTDTHVLNETHRQGRHILQISKNIFFDGEENWDLTFKTYEELVQSYRIQNAIPEETYMQAIENTNLLQKMIDGFSLDKSTKYPKIYDNPSQVFREKINKAIEKHPYALKNHTREEIDKVVDMEFDVYERTGSVDFMLMQTYIREWEKENGIQCGYGRGSVTGSMVAYLLDVTQMDSIRFDLNFFRFMNPSRVTNAD